jgi:hypothetical protein
VAVIGDEEGSGIACIQEKVGIEGNQCFFRSENANDEVRRVLEDMNRKLTKVRRELRIDELNKDLFTWEDGNTRDTNNTDCPSKYNSSMCESIRYFHGDKLMVLFDCFLGGVHLYSPRPRGREIFSP